MKLCTAIFLSFVQLCNSTLYKPIEYSFCAKPSDNANFQFEKIRGRYWAVSKTLDLFDPNFCGSEYETPLIETEDDWKSYGKLRGMLAQILRKFLSNTLGSCMVQ